jgi:hypothetical protein
LSVAREAAERLEARIPSVAEVEVLLELPQAVRNRISLFRASCTSFSAMIEETPRFPALASMELSKLDWV